MGSIEGGGELLSDDVFLLAGEGDVLFNEGRYLDAIAKFEEAEEKHGGRIGIAQGRMGVCPASFGEL